MPNSEMHLKGKSCIQVHMHVCGIYVLGHGQKLDRAIIHVTACCPAQTGAYCLKSIKIERSHSDFNEAISCKTLGAVA